MLTTLSKSDKISKSPLEADKSIKHENRVRKAKIIRRIKPDTFANNYSLTERYECDKILKLSQNANNIQGYGNKKLEKRC